MNLRTWRKKQKLASPSTYYGGEGTWHRNEMLDVETHDGVIVAVWYRCMMLPFRRIEVDAERANEMLKSPASKRLTGIEVR